MEVAFSICFFGEKGLDGVYYKMCNLVRFARVIWVLNIAKLCKYTREFAIDR